MGVECSGSSDKELAIGAGQQLDRLFNDQVVTNIASMPWGPVSPHHFWLPGDVTKQREDRVYCQLILSTLIKRISTTSVATSCNHGSEAIGWTLAWTIAGCTGRRGCCRTTNIRSSTNQRSALDWLW